MPKVGRKRTKFKFYAVAKGRVPGVYTTWDACKAQVAGFVGNKHHKFATREQAERYLSNHGVASSSSPRSSSQVALEEPRLPTHPRRPKPYSKCKSKSKPKPERASRSRPEPKPARPTSARWAELTTERIEDESGWDVVYSDGACKSNGQPGSAAGLGVWWGKDDARTNSNLSERCPGGQTNNRAELMAIVRVLETAPHQKRPLLIKTDSKYSISCFRDWMPKWLASNFVSSSGQPVKNAPLIRYLSALLDQRAREGQKARRVHLQYVKGHSGEPGNEGADRLANLGTRLWQPPECDWDLLTARLTPQVNAAQGKMDDDDDDDEDGLWAQFDVS